MFKRIVSILAPVLLTAGIIIGGAEIAQASTVPGSYAFVIQGTNIYMNAWNNGPAIATYDQNTLNDSFYFIYGTAPGSVAFQYANSGPNYGGIVGDWDNSTTNARAGITTGYGMPWGGNFIQYSCNNGQGIAFKNIHWGGWLAPALPTQNGGAWYLNSGYEACFQYEG